MKQRVYYQRESPFNQLYFSFLQYSIQVYRGYTLMVDSGALYDSTITGGRLGVLQFGEMSVIWSNLRATCVDHTNQALYFDGADDYVTLDDMSTLQITDR